MANKKSSERETIIYLVWLLLVIVWNFGWPGAAPIEDRQNLKDFARSKKS